MKIIKDLFTDKKWLAFGSLTGGALGALLIHINEFMPLSIQGTFDLPMGMGLAVALGMVGGILGGVIGSFISGAIVKEEVVVNVGQSLGVGLINGFILGTIIGVALGLLHKWRADLITPVTLSIFIGGVVVIALLVFLVGRRE